MSERNDGTKAVVKYDVFDKGIGKINPSIEYRLTNFENATNEDKTVINENREITVTGKIDSYDTWQVKAFFSDTLGNSKVTIIGKLIENKFNAGTPDSWNAGSAMAVILLILIFVTMLISGKFGNENEQAKGNGLW